jgi:DNA invertase Pin-like site-specific DNA recombinase
MQKMRSGEYDGILVTRLDRFARSSRELILDVDEILKKNIFFISVIDNLDFSTASGKLHFHLLCAFAEFERSLISDRVRQSLQRLKSEGKKLGRPQGSGDKKRRRKSGYLLREAHKRQNKDQDSGSYKHIEEYLK